MEQAGPSRGRSGARARGLPLRVALLLASLTALGCWETLTVRCEQLELTFHARYAATATQGPSVRPLPFSREIELHAFDALDVWAPTRQEADDILAGVLRARRSEQELLGEFAWHLTVVAIDRLPQDESIELVEFARTPETLVIAWPTESMLAASLRAAIQETARGLGYGPMRDSGPDAFSEFAAAIARESLAPVLEHEYGHLAVAARVHEPDGSGGAGYGTSLPDWLEESIAMAFTPAPPEARAQAVAAIRRSSLPVTRFVADRHPGAARVGGAGGAKPWVEIEATIRIEGAPRSSEAPTVANLYYPFSQLFGEFLVDTAGPGALGELLALALSTNGPETGWPDVPEGSRLPEDAAALEAAFSAWLAAQPQEQGES